MSDREYLLCSAIHFDDGKMYEHQPRNIGTGFVIAGRRHHNCFATIRILTKSTLKQCKQVQGFLTNMDRFLNRTEAYIVAKEANQLLSEKLIGSVLTSEDVW